MEALIIKMMWLVQDLNKRTWLGCSCNTFCIIHLTIFVNKNQWINKYQLNYFHMHYWCLY
jgi:hypothetical protein